MPIQEDLDSPAEAEGPGVSPEGLMDAPDEAAESEREKVIVRSNGVVTYVGKDIAYQFWKLGLLGRDFHYRRSSSARRNRCGRRPAPTAPRSIRRLAAPRTSTTSSTCGSPTCRSC
jgi:hypothetical protein